MTILSDRGALVGTLCESLRLEREKRPALEAQDAVKHIFQALLGVGHLLGRREAVAARIAAEEEGLAADPAEPLLEAVGPFWCRLNLRRAMVEGLAPDMIASLMLQSASNEFFTRRDVHALCGELVDGISPADQDAILDEGWLPSHSEAYRAAYRPAYRVISADWLPCAEALCAIARAVREEPRFLVTLDGPCASGKTTLARRLAEVFRAELVHTDDFYTPHTQKTPERLAIPGGNCDADRLAAELIAPWRKGEPAVYRRYDCHNDCMVPPEPLSGSPVMLLEGSYCNLPVLRAWADVRLFLDVPEELRMRRLQQRESEASLRQFAARWIPLENAYFTAYGLPDEGCLVLRMAEDEMIEKMA